MTQPGTFRARSAESEPMERRVRRTRANRNALGGIFLLSLLVAAPAWAGTALVVVEGNRLSARLDQVPLDELLQHLARAVPVRVTSKGPTASDRVSLVLDDVDLERGLRQILQGRSYMLVHAENPGPGAGRRLVEIVVIGESSARPPATAGARGNGDRERAASLDGALPAPTPERPRPPRISRPEDELRQSAFAGATPEDRRGALTVIHHRMPGADGTEILAAALGDDDERVRALALRQLADREDAPPTHALARVARHDPSPSVRRQALDLLVVAAPGDARRELEEALSDPDPLVSRQAEALLEATSTAVQAP
jgi:hypothetical protein